MIEMVNLAVHYKGSFKKVNGQIKYVDEKFADIQGLDIDKICYFVVCDIASEIGGYEREVFIYYRAPNMSLSDGLFLIMSDVSTNEMIKYLEKCNTIELYVSEGSVLDVVDGSDSIVGDDSNRNVWAENAIAGSGVGIEESGPGNARSGAGIRGSEAANEVSVAGIDGLGSGNEANYTSESCNEESVVKSHGVGNEDDDDDDDDDELEVSISNLRHFKGKKTSTEGDTVNEELIDDEDSDSGNDDEDSDSGNDDEDSDNDSDSGNINDDEGVAKDGFYSDYYKSSDPRSLYTSDDDCKQDMATRRKSRYPSYIGRRGRLQSFQLGMIFKGPNQFREVITKYSVAAKRELVYVKNKTTRMRVKCVGKNCP